MKYTVVWTPDAREQLAEIWLEASDRDAVTLAATKIEQSLKHDPLNTGESRVVNIRIVIEQPLALFCDVYPQDLRV